MDTQEEKEVTIYDTRNSLMPRRVLIVTPSSTKAMDVSGGVAKVTKG